MILRIDPANPEPLFQQLVQAVKHAVATGRLAAGDRLPSVRDLAKDLVVNPNTVARAYQVLDAEGVTLSRRGAGTFVAEPRAVLRTEEGRRRYRTALDTVLTDALHLGLTEKEIRRGFEQALARLVFPDGGKEDA